MAIQRIERSVFLFAGALVLAVTTGELVVRLVSVSSLASSSEISVRADTRPPVHRDVIEARTSERIVHVTVPMHAQFVASRRGKKYYEIGSPMAERLVPGNRVYFESAEEAARAGYRK